MLLRKTPLSKKLTSEDVEKKLKDVVRDFFSLSLSPMFLSVISNYQILYMEFGTDFVGGGGWACLGVWW